MSPDFESPFLAHYTPHAPDDEGPLPGGPPELESPFLSELESPFVNAESGAAPFLAGEGEGADDPSLFRLEEPAEGEWAEAGEAVLDEPKAWAGEQDGARSDAEGGWEAEKEAEVAEEEGEVTGIDQEYDSEAGEGFSWEEKAGEEEAVAVESEVAGSRVQARILWPALGCPAIVAPRAGSREAATLLVDATRCITVLLLCDRPALSKAEAARYLRIVPWSERGRRYISAGNPGSFPPEQLVVRHDGTPPRLTLGSASGKDNTVVAFGGDGDGGNAVVVNLPAYVSEVYAKAGMKYLHEIRLSEAASSGLRGGTYHVFWNNHQEGEDAPSDELAFLCQTVARANRQKDLALWQRAVPEPERARATEQWRKNLPAMLGEYEFEFGYLHQPYKAKERRQRRRAEILHPVFVRAAPPVLKVAHVTDLHVDVRWDVFESNLKASKVPRTVEFNNCNTSSAAIYADARATAEVVLMTGDLIDYGRGHVGLGAKESLGQDRFYHRDRNWFLFYDLLVAQERYERPVFTCLGNHDWRMNPYPPFAPGAPDPSEIFHNFRKWNKDGLKALVREAHGRGHEAEYSYNPRWKNIDLVDVAKVMGKATSGSETLEDAGLPTETTVDSVAWYLLSVNPFLDYSCALPGGYKLLMLDFARREALLASDTRLGKNYGWLDPRDGRSRGPRALACLTRPQQWMVREFTKLAGKAKMIGMHVPPLGPYPDWSEEDLQRGFKTYAKPLEARGPTKYVFEDARGAKFKGHPMFAIRPDGFEYGMDAEYGSFRSARSEFIRELAKPSAGVQLVFSGHIHRNDLLAVHVPSNPKVAALKGKYLMKSLAYMPSAAAGTPHAPQTLPRKVVDPRRITDGRAPLYVNTTSAGPLGNFQPATGAGQVVAPGWTYVELSPAGVIEQVSFRFPVRPAPLPAPVTAKEVRAAF